MSRASDVGDSRGGLDSRRRGNDKWLSVPRIFPSLRNPPAANAQARNPLSLEHLLFDRIDVALLVQRLGSDRLAASRQDIQRQHLGR